MRIRSLVAALGAASLLAGGAVTTALPAQAAPCDGPCVDVTIEAPDRIGIGGDPNEFSVGVVNRTGETVQSAGVELHLASPDVDLHSIFDAADDQSIRLEQYVDGAGWSSLFATESGDGGLRFVLPIHDLAPTSDVDVPVRISAASVATLNLLGPVINDSDFFLNPAERLAAAQGTSTDVTVRAVLLGSATEGDTPVLATDQTAITVGLLPLDVPREVPVTLDEPAEFRAGITNPTGSSYDDVLLLPMLVPGGDSAVEQAVGATSDLRSTKAVLRAVQQQAADTATEMSFRSGGAWVPLAEAVDRLDDLALAADDGASDSVDWRITVRDPGALRTPTPRASDDPNPDFGNNIIWFALRGSPEASPSGAHPLGLAATEIVAAPVPSAQPTPTPTPTGEPTTAPVVDVDPTDSTPADEDDTGGDEAPGTDDGAGGGDDEGIGAGGELATTGQNLSSQAMAALLMLVVGALAVVSTLQRRRVRTHG